LIEPAAGKIRIAFAIAEDAIAIAPLSQSRRSHWWNGRVSSAADPSSMTGRIAQWWRSHKGKNVILG
jgi:hypothetical protein